MFNPLFFVVYRVNRPDDGSKRFNPPPSVATQTVPALSCAKPSTELLLRLVASPGTA